MSTGTALQHQVVTADQWLEARKALLAKEKELCRQRDEVSRLRRALPWEKVDKHYVFEGPNGPETLSDLFGGRSQLIVYHFMFPPGATQGCPLCSFLADHIDASLPHLAPKTPLATSPSDMIRASSELGPATKPGIIRSSSPLS